MVLSIVLEVDNKIEDLQDEMDSVHLEEGDSDGPSSDKGDGFMTESVYGKLNSNSSPTKAPKKARSKSKENHRGLTWMKLTTWGRAHINAYFTRAFRARHGNHRDRNPH